MDNSIKGEPLVGVFIGKNDKSEEDQELEASLKEMAEKLGKAFGGEGAVVEVEFETDCNDVTEYNGTTIEGNYKVK